MSLITPTPGQIIRCESSGCQRIATHAYGPECEADNLMYLCDWHADAVRQWISANPNQPVICPNHGLIGVVKNAAVLARL